MSGDEERRRLESSVRAGFRAAESLVEASGQLTVKAAVAVVAGVAALALAVTYDAVEGRVFFALLACVGIGLSLEMIGRLRGQREIVNRWRNALEQPTSRDDLPSSGL